MHFKKLLISFFIFRNKNFENYQNEPDMEKEKIYRNTAKEKKMIAGVAAGLSDYLQIEVIWIRIFFLLLFFMHGGGLMIYIILWIVLPIRSHSVTISDNENIDEIDKQKSSKWLSFLGIFFIFSGLYYLLIEFNCLPEWINWAIIGPIALISLGLALVFNFFKEKNID